MSDQPKYDSVVSSVVSMFENRARIGQVKYGHWRCVQCFWLQPGRGK